MKITNFNLINIANILQKYSEKKFPQKISYAITRNLMIISKEYEVYDKQLKKIFEEYSEYFTKDKDGNIEINENGIPIVNNQIKNEFNEQINDLLNIEINIDIYYVDIDIFNYEDQGIYDTMSAQDIMILQSVLCRFES